MTSNHRLLLSGLDLVHEVLKEKNISEELRIKLCHWRDLAEMMIDVQPGEVN